MKNNRCRYKKNIVLILSTFFVFFPWISYLKIVEYSETEQKVFANYRGIAIDLFLYYKEVVLILMAVFLICWFAGEHLFTDYIERNIPLRKADNRILFVLTGIFILAVIISTVVSENKHTAVWGSPTEREGIFTLISYVILILGFYNYFATPYAVKIIRKTMLIITIITILLSFVEILYKPLIEIELIQKIISPEKYESLISSGGISSLGKAVSLSFYNPDYYGGFVCMLIPFIFFFLLNVRQAKQILFLAILMAGLTVCVIASNVTTSVYVAVIEIFFTIGLYLCKCRQKRKNLIRIVCICAGMVLVAFAYGMISKNSILGILKNDNAHDAGAKLGRFLIEDIVLDKNQLLIKGQEHELNILYKDGQLVFTDEKNSRLPVVYENGIFSFSDVAYEDITIEVIINATQEADEIHAKMLVDAGYDDTIDFYLLKDGNIAGIGQNNAIQTQIKYDEPFEGARNYYSLFTGRGYAWVYSLPIIKQTLFKGVGPGNFAYHFKQTNYVGMLQTHSSVKYIVDKPHNMYLQYGINIGVIGMISFFMLIIIALFRTFQLYKNFPDMNEDESVILMSMAVSVCGFLIYSFINDSIVSVTPMICMMTGMMMAVTYMLHKGDNNVAKK